MNFDEEFRQELGPYFEDRQRRKFQADILFQDDPLPSTGEAILDTDGLGGVFFPKERILQGKNPAKAKILKKSEDWQVEIQNLREVRSASGVHYRFDLVEQLRLVLEKLGLFDWATSGQALLHQLEKFRTLFGPDIENTPVGYKLASPETVLAFARNLMLCATEQSAASCIGQGRESARTCYILSNDFATAENKESAQFLIPEPPFRTLFFLLASIAMARARLAIEKNEGKWGVYRSKT
jgi:hypothetical protein